MNILYFILTEVLWQAMAPINSILSLYSAGLVIISYDQKSRAEDPSSGRFKYLLGTLLENEQVLQHSPPSDCGAYLSLYVEALKFICEPLAKSINSERKQLVVDKDDFSAKTMLSTVQDAFHTLCQLTLSSPRYIQDIQVYFV